MTLHPLGFNQFVPKQFHYGGNEDMNNRDMVSGLKVRFYFRNGCALVLAALLLIGCGQMKAGIKEMNTYFNDLRFTPRSETVTAERLNLRASPSANSKIIAQLRKEEQVIIDDQNGNWVKVKLNSEKVDGSTVHI